MFGWLLLSRIKGRISSEKQHRKLLIACRLDNKQIENLKLVPKLVKLLKRLVAFKKKSRFCIVIIR